MFEKEKKQINHAEYLDEGISQSTSPKFGASEPKLYSSEPKLGASAPNLGEVEGGIDKAHKGGNK